MKLTDQDSTGTSFHDVTIQTTLSRLIEILGTPQYCKNDGEDKVNVSYDCETANGDVFTIYDWKENRPINNNENIKWHIGGYGIKDTLTAKLEILRLLNDTKNN